jgi:hypothetical protein
LHAVLQHTPSTQWFVWQCASSVHVSPFAPSALHLPSAQYAPLMQSPSPPQLAGHVPVAHLYRPQSAPVEPYLHAPRPSHSCPWGALPTHWALPHTVPLAYRRQAPAPSHEPSRWQLDAASVAHSLSGSEPAAIRPHSPSWPAPFLADVHASHVPEHALSQHTPSMQ